MHTIKAEQLPEELRQILHVKPQQFVNVVEEKDGIKLKNQLIEAAEQIGEIIKDDFAKIGVVDDQTAIDYIYKLRYGEI